MPAVSTPPLHVADNRSGLDVTPAGTPIVNIAAPDDSGTSHNVYTTFSVGKEGLIFNNSPTTGQSTVGGFLLANPNLVQGSAASLILNEVTGGVRTTLGGPMEVFGQKAALVIANPTGITCDGCGFINTTRVSLAAANPQFGSDGRFTGFATSGADVSIEGQGLLAGNVDYFDIVAAVSHINASLYARDLVVAGGTGSFDYASRTASGNGSTGVVLDSSALGGMYANRIRLIGTGAGVGINLVGTVAALDGPLEITSDGAIQLAQTTSSGDAAITSQSGAITLTDQTYAGGNLTLQGQSISQDAGFAGAMGNVMLSVADNATLAGSGIYAGLDGNGNLAGAGTLTVGAGGALDTANATLASGGGLAINAASLTQASGGQFGGAGIRLTTGGGQSLAGAITSTADASLAGDTIDLAGTLGASGKLALSGRQITLSGTATGLASASGTVSDRFSITDTGAFQSNGSAILTAPRLDLAGALIGGGDVALFGANLANSGTVLSGGDFFVTSAGDAVLGGTISTNGNAELTAGGTANLSGSLASAAMLDFKASSISVGGSVQAGEALLLTSTGDLSIDTAAHVLGDGPVSLAASRKLDLGGEAASNDTLSLTAQTADIKGSIQALGVLTLTAGGLAVSGEALSGGDASVTVAGTADVTGALSAGGDLALSAAELTAGPAAQLLAGKSATITTLGAFTHAGALSGGAVTILADRLANIGTVVAGDSMALSGASSLTQAGAIQAGGSLALSGSSIMLSGQTIGAANGIGGISINAPSLALASTSDLESGNSLTLATDGDLASRGAIVALGAVSIESAGTLAQNAAISGNDAVSLTAGATLAQAGAVEAAGPINLSAATITNSGSLASNDALRLDATDLIASSGSLLAGKALTLVAPRLTLSGTTASNDLLTLTAPALTLSGVTSGFAGISATIDSLTLTSTGALQSGEALSLDLTALDNAGLISSGTALNLSIKGSFANNGQIVGGTTFGLVAHSGLASTGLLQAGTNLTARIAGEAQLGGTIYAGQDVSVAADSLALSGAVAAERNLGAATSGSMVLASGSTAHAASGLTLSAADLTAAGTVQSDSTLSVAVDQALYLGGNTQVSGTSVLAAGRTATISGTLASGGMLTLTAPIVSIPGQILVNDAVNVTANAGNLSLAGTIQAASDVALTAVQRLTIGTAGASSASPGGGSFDGASASGGSGLSSWGSDSPDDASSSPFTLDVPQLAAAVPGSLASSGAVTLRAADIDIYGMVAAKGDLSALASHVLTVNGSVWTDDKLTADIGSLAVGVDASFAAQGLVEVTAVSDISNLGTIASNGGDVTLAYAGAFSNLGTISASNAYGVIASGDYTSAGTVSADTVGITARDITLAGITVGTNGLTLAGRNLSLLATSDVEGGGPVSLISSAGSALAGKLVGSEDITLTAGTTLDLASSAEFQAGGDLTLNAADLTSAGALHAAQGIIAATSGDARWGGTLIAGTVDGSGAVTGLADLSLNATGLLDFTGTASATGDALLKAASLSAGGDLVALNNLTLDADVLSTTGALQANEVLTASATGNASLGGTLSGLSGVSIVSGGSLAQSAQLASNGVLTLTAADSLTHTGSSAAVGNIAFSGSTLALGGTVAGNAELDLTATSGSAAISGNGVLSAKTVTLASAADTHVAGSLIATSDLAASVGSKLSVSATGVLQAGTSDASGNVISTGAMVLGANTAIENAGLISSTGGLQFNAPSLVNTGTITVGTDINLSAASISLGGRFLSLGDVSVFTTAGALAIAGGLEGRNITLSASGGDLTLGTASHLTVYGTGGDGLLSLASTGTITSLGAVAANNDVTLTAGQAIHIGADRSGADLALSTAGNITLAAGGALVNDGTIQADKSLTISATSLASNSLLTGDTLNFTASGDIALAGTTWAMEGVSLTSSGGTLSLADTAAIQSHGEIHLASAGALSNAGVISAGTAGVGGPAGTVSLTSGGALVSTGAIVSNNDAVNLTGTSITLGGALGSRGGVYATTNLSFVTPQLTLLDGGEVVANDVLSYTGTSLTLGNDSLLQSNHNVTVTLGSPSAAGGYTSAGNLIALGDLTLDVVGGALVNRQGSGIFAGGSGGSASGGSITLGAASIDNAGLIVATVGSDSTRGNLAITAPTIINMGLIHADKGLTLTTSNLTIDGSLATAEKALGAIESGDAFGVTSAKVDLINGATLRSAGDVTLHTADLNVAGTILSGGDLDLHATGGFTASGVLGAARAVSLTSGGGMTLNGTVAASGGDLSVAAVGTLTLGSQGRLYGDTGLTASADRIIVAAPASSGTIAFASHGDIGLSSVHGLDLSGGIVADGSVSLADAASLSLGAGSLISAGTIQAAPSVNSSTITLRAASLSSLGTLAATGRLGLTGDTVTIGGNATANGDVTLSGYTVGISPSLAINAGGQLASYLGNANLGMLSSLTVSGTLLASNGDVSFSAPGAVITDTGRLAAGRNLAITTAGGGNLSVQGKVLANGDLALTGGILIVGSSGAIQAGNDLTFITSDAANGVAFDSTGAPVSATIAGKLAAGRNLTLSMPGALIAEETAQIVASNDMALTAGHALIEARYTTDGAGNALTLGVIAGHDLTFANSLALVSESFDSRGLRLDGSIQAGNNLTINASGEVLSTDYSQIIAGNALTISGSALSLGGFNSAGGAIDFIATGNTPPILFRPLTPGDIAIRGTTVSGGRMSLRGNTGIVTQTGSITAYGGAGNTTPVGLDVGASANVDIETNGAFTNNGAIWSDGLVFLKSASGNILNNAGDANGGITGGTIVVQTDGGSFYNSAGAFKAANAGLFLSGDFTNSGTFAPSGNYWLSAANISNSGLLAASGSLRLDASGNLTNTGTIFAGNNLALNVGGALANDYVGDDQGNGSHGLILAQNDINITAHDVVNQSATIQSLAGGIGITLTGGSFSNVIQTLAFSAEKVRYRVCLQGTPTRCTEPDFQWYETGGTAVSANTGTATISAAGNIWIDAGNGDVTNRNSAILAGGNISITTSGSVANLADQIATATLAYDSAGVPHTTTISTASLQDAPTLIQARGTVAINSGSFSGEQIVQGATPDTLSNGAPGTGSTGNVASSTTRQAGNATSTAFGTSGNSASTTGAGTLNSANYSSSAAGLGRLESAILSAGTGGNASLAVRSGTGTAALTALTASAASDASTISGSSAIGSVAGGGSGAQAVNLVSTLFDVHKLTGGTGQSVDGIAEAVVDVGAGSLAPGAQSQAPLATQFVLAFNGAGLPNLSNQGFGTFLGGFLSSFNLTGNSPSLFTYSSNPDSAYLFTTDAALSSQAALYDSSYFFDRLSTDRATTYTRLGDGFFEAMLVSREVQAATGQAQLSEFGSALGQYQGLLKNAADQQGRLGLSLGVALTGEQVAQLTSPLLWYVSANVGGRDVLVPVLYLAASDQKAISNTALVGGTNVLISAEGGITNNGTIKASQIVALAAGGGDLVNGTGGVIIGGSVVAQAANDILLKGGGTIAATGSGSYAVPGGPTIDGGVVSLSAGHDIVTSAVVSTDVTVDNTFNNSRNWSKSTTLAQKVTGAAISSTAGTQLAAGNDMALNAATLASQGATALVAGSDITLGGTAATTNTWTAARTGKYKSSYSTTQETTVTGTTVTAAGPISIAALGGGVSLTGSLIQTTDPAAGVIDIYGATGVTIASAENTSSGYEFQRTGKKSTVTIRTTSLTNTLSAIDAAGDLTVITPGALTVAGGSLVSGGALGIDAGSVAVSGVVDLATSDVATWKKKSGLLSSKVTRTHTVTSDETVQASVLSGETVEIATPGAVDIMGSAVVASNGLAIDAGGPVSIGAMTETDSYNQTVSVKKSGFSLSGGGLFIGVAKVKTAVDSTQVTHVGSLVGTENGDAAIISADKLSVIGSQIAAGGDVLLAGKSIDIANALDTADTTQTRKSSSVGVSIGAQSQIIQSTANLIDAAKIATSTGNDRVAAVAGLAGGMAAVNAYNAGKDLVSTLGKGQGSLGVTVGVNFGISKSRSTSQSHDETVVLSQVTGNNVTLVATGQGSQGTIDVTGSNIAAAKDLTLVANGPITIAAAQETDTQSGNAKSSGFNVGVSMSLGLSKDQTGKSSLGLSGPTVSVGASSSKSNYAGTDVANIESTLAAGTARISTPDALVIDGSTVSGEKVAIDAGSLAIASRQDTSTYGSRSKSASVGASLDLATGQVSVSGNFATGKQNGDFASVAEQAGIYAGSQGFDIKVAGSTDLTGAVISSEADAAKNSLVTGTLTASDMANRESWKASQTSLGGGIGGIGGDRQGEATATGSTPLPGVNVAGLGTVSATPPLALGTGGSQSGTTISAIAPGAITITSDDPASQVVSATISRDTATANAGALTQAFTDAKREEVAQGFQAAQILATETSAFFAREAQQAEIRKKEAETGYRLDNTGQVLLDDQGNPIALTPEERLQAGKEAERIGKDYGAGSTARLVATAIGGAVGSDATGSLTGLVQASAVNVLQGLATQQVKLIADSLGSEEARAALQGIVGCAGSTAGGSGDCASGALGAAASVVLNNLFKNGTTTGTDENGRPLDLEAQQGRDNLVSTLTSAIAAGAGLDVGAAVTAARIEGENNSISTSEATYGKGDCKPNGTTCFSREQFLARSDVLALQEATGLTPGQIYACAINDATICTPQVSAIYQATKEQAQVAADANGATDIAAQPAETGISFSVPSLAGELVASLNANELAGIAELPGAAAFSQYSSVLGLEANFASRLPGPFGKAAQTGLIAGTTLAVGLATVTIDDTDRLPSSFGTPMTPVDPAAGQKGNIETLPVADPIPPLPGLVPERPPLEPLITPIPKPGELTPPPFITPVAQPLPPLPGLEPAPVNTGTVLANTPTKPSFILGQSDGGPGIWVENGPFGKPADQCYQCQVTGAPLGVEYRVNGVDFDGYDPATNTLIDGKNFVDWPVDKPFSIQKVLKQANGQVDAARGTGASIEWRVASPAKADVVRDLLKENGDLPIKVVVEPPKGL